jgi:hypothetical protein
MVKNTECKPGKIKNEKGRCVNVPKPKPMTKSKSKSISSAPNIQMLLNGIKEEIMLKMDVNHNEIKNMLNGSDVSSSSSSSDSDSNSSYKRPSHLIPIDSKELQYIKSYELKHVSVAKTKKNNMEMKRDPKMQKLRGQLIAKKRQLKKQYVKMRPKYSIIPLKPTSANLELERYNLKVVPKSKRGTRKKHASKTKSYTPRHGWSDTWY